MTPARLEELKAYARKWGWNTGGMILELAAEVERLRGLIKKAEFVDGDLGAYCPHCIGVNNSAYSVSGHRDDCPAFTPEGEVK